MRRVDPRTRGQKVLTRYALLLPVGTFFVGLTILGLTYAFANIPLPDDIELTLSTEVFDANGKSIGSYSGEITRFPFDPQKLLEKKPFIGQAVLAAEDRSFYEHNGVSVRGVIRAAWANMTGGQVQQGGSTITQQYVKNAVLQDPSRTVTRKVREAVLAVKLERQYSKDQILGFYLETIYLGRGTYGFEAAARRYFNKSVSQINLSEAAYLASIIPSPEAYQIDEDRDLAESRRDRVLTEMVKLGFVTQDKADAAMNKRLKLARTADHESEKRSKAAYFMEWLRKNFLQEEFGSDLYTGGLQIHTTLDLELQAAAERAVRTMLPNPEDPQAALVSMTPRGGIRAMVGGKAFRNVSKARGFNYATSEPGRQPGSSLKPFTLVTAIDQGISPRSRFSGASPTQIEDPECATNFQPWEVNNYGNSSFGTIDLVQATTNSVNTVYAQLMAEVGAESVAKMLEEFGFNPKYGAENINPVCANALGGGEDVTPLEMARAYAGFAGRGKLPHVNPVAYITDSQGNCIKRYLGSGDCEERVGGRAPEEIIDENSADVLTQSLTGVVSAGTATNANIGRPVAGKTGTTQDNGNAWFAGYTPQLSTVVWVGYPLEGGPDGKIGTECGQKAESEQKRLERQSACAEDDFIPEMRSCSDLDLCRPVLGDLSAPIEVTGGSFPARIWGAYMSEAVADMPVEEFAIPAAQPSEIINGSPPPSTSAPEPEPTGDGDDDDEPEPEPTTQPTQEPTQEPEPEPSEPAPTSEPSPGARGGGGGGGGGGQGGGDP